jgi:hypothetical protein
MLTFEGEQFQGVQNVMAKIVVLPVTAALTQGLAFQKVAHKISTLDTQPTTGGAAIVMVTGELLVRKRAAADIDRGTRASSALQSSISSRTGRRLIFCSQRCL